ncbi:CPBP family glutamic-type intramembrane protease [Patiriisocius marinus]|uniref:CAAX prenyl protease 2/Lysostaphin resistance protein A-like domain-containing protein n=1 Tax=Patiriisocius marinus TaxID=1397112 RepID=A0A5J4J043_9FLAO|nr:CPBP family glutamic-type intramembrane protease [Patiriisocius marinus]GER59123.1 hypothetical protein ULMA_12310 [Patiriisocius marinus]
MNILNNLWLLAKTGNVEQGKSDFSKSFSLLIKLFIILILFKILYLALVLGIELSASVTIPKVANDLEFDNYNGLLKFTLVALIAPILEELTFRLGLKFSKTNVLFFIAGITYIFLKIIIQLEWYICLIMVAVITLLFSLVLKNKLLQKLKDFWKKNRLLLFYFLLFSFTFLHITNFKLDNAILIYLPLLMLPHLLAGFVFSYARLKSGILLAICLHVLNNGLFALPLLLGD